MNALLILAPLALAALLGGKRKASDKPVKVLIELEGDYKNPNGEATELDGTLAEIKADIMTAFPGNAWLTVDDDVATVETVGDYYPNQLIPTDNGQIVVWKVVEA